MTCLLWIRLTWMFLLVCCARGDVGYTICVGGYQYRRLSLFDICAKNSDIIEITTKDPDNRPLASFELLELQWTLSRIAAIQGHGDDHDDDEDQSKLKNCELQLAAAAHPELVNERGQPRQRAPRETEDQRVKGNFTKKTEYIPSEKSKRKVAAEILEETPDGQRKRPMGKKELAAKAVLDAQSEKADSEALTQTLLNQRDNQIAPLGSILSSGTVIMSTIPLNDHMNSCSRHKISSFGTSESKDGPIYAVFITSTAPSSHIKTDVSNSRVTGSSAWFNSQGQHLDGKGRLPGSH